MKRNFKGNEGLTTPHKSFRDMKKETNENEDWFIKFLKIWIVHASYWIIITLLIRYINTHG